MNKQEKEQNAFSIIMTGLALLFSGLAMLFIIYSGMSLNFDYDTRKISDLNKYKAVTLKSAVIATNTDNLGHVNKYVTGISDDRVIYKVSFYNKKLISIPKNGIVTVYVMSSDEDNGYQTEQQIKDAKNHVRSNAKRFEVAYHKEIKYKPIIGFALMAIGCGILVLGIISYHKVKSVGVDNKSK